MRICDIADCNNQHKAHGLCRLHYERMFKHGTLETTRFRNQNRMKHPLYSTYNNMMQRCTNPNNTYFKNYGGRGITVCDRWRGEKGFTNFVTDMGNKPTSTHSIERVDNEKGYSPDNCIWATRLEQNNNQRVRKDNTSGHKGIYWNEKGKKWEARRSLNKVEHCLGFFDTKEEAIEARKQFELKKGLLI